MFDITSEQKSKQKDFQERVKIAQQNAKYSIYATRIQRYYNAFKLKRSIIMQSSNNISSKLRDIRKILKIPKIKEKFFLTPDKLTPLLVEFYNTLIPAYTKFKKDDKDKKKILNFDQILENFKSMNLILNHCFNLENPKIQVNNIVYNYFSGNTKIRNCLKTFIFKLEKYSKFLKNEKTLRKNSQEFEESLGDFMMVLLDSKKIPKLLLGIKDIYEKSNVIDYIQTLLNFETVVAYLNNKNFVCNEFLSVYIYLRKLGIFEKKNQENNVKAFDSDFMNLFDTLIVIILIKKKSELKNLDKFSEKIELFKEISEISFVEFFQKINLEKSNVLFRGCKISIEDIFNTSIENADLRDYAKIEDQLKILDMVNLQLKNVCYKENEKIKNFGSFEKLKNWIYELLKIHHQNLKTGDNSYNQVVTKLLNFLSELQSQRQNYIIFKGIILSLFSQKNFLQYFFTTIFTKLSSLMKLTQESSTISLPTENHLLYLRSFINTFHQFLIINDVKDFFNNIENKNIDLKKLLKIMLYLQNLLAYDFLLLEGTKTEYFTLIEKNKISQIMSIMHEYNNMKQYFDKNFFQMCKLNSYLYENFIDNYYKWEEKDFFHFYNMIKLFPHCFTFEKRVEFFYHALSLKSKNDGTSTVAKIRREFVVEDGISIFSQLAIEGNLHNKIKVYFYDQFGNMEVGQDDGGLFKEFLYLLLKEVNL